MTWKKLLNSKVFLLALLAFFGLSCYFLGKELYERYKVEKDITALKDQIYELEKGNEELSQLIEYFKSTSYQEKELRQKLDLQKPGEHVVVLPDSVASVSPAAPTSTQSASQENWKSWWNYFFAEKPVADEEQN